ncbi:PAS domain-containing protein [Paraburkholderia sp. BR13439]|uniref:PAS domain-containing protein n=1 Tax=Paraburkholderia TaxID=1822464 RepID=UPI0034CF139A
MKTELSRVVDELPGLVWSALPDGRIEFVNRRWCEYTGLSADQAGCRRLPLQAFQRHCHARSDPGCTPGRMIHPGAYAWSSK